MGAGAIRKGTHVRVRLGDAVCPDFDKLSNQIGPEVAVCGDIAYFSDRGAERDQFAIISVEGLDAPLIVPVAKLRPAGGALESAATEDQVDHGDLLELESG